MSSTADVHNELMPRRMGRNSGGGQEPTHAAPPACANDGANPTGLPPPDQSVNGPLSDTCWGNAVWKSRAKPKGITVCGENSWVDRTENLLKLLVE